MNHIKPVLAYITKRVVSDDARVLDLGCGPGWFRDLPKGRYVGFDVTSEPYSASQPRLVDVIGSARFLPFREASFDLVFIVAALHLFPGPVLCLMEARRVLKPGGRLICFDYTRRTHVRLRDKYYEEGAVSYNLLDGDAMVDMCRLAGFNRVTLGCFLPSLALRLPLPWSTRPVLAPLLDRRGGWWLAEATTEPAMA
jgi:SAM-dependent methyltransferase